MFAFHLCVDVVIVDPAIAMADDLVAACDKGVGHLWVLFKRCGHAEYTERNVELGEDTKHTPDTDSRAVLKGRFHERAACARHRRKTDVVEHPLRGRVPGEDVCFPASFVVEIKVERYTGVAGPLRMGWIFAVTHVIAWPVVCCAWRHCAPPSPCASVSVACSHFRSIGNIKPLFSSWRMAQVRRRIPCGLSPARRVVAPMGV